MQTKTRKHVEIVAVTEKDPVKAAALLIFTKATRLAMDGAELQKVEDKCKDDPQWMADELDYMSKTIRSSWEFLDVTFSIRSVSRACAQQITRTRFTPIDGDLYGSYAMQSQRVTDMSAATWHNPVRELGGNQIQAEVYDDVIRNVILNYRDLIEGGMKDDEGNEMPPVSLEDARGVLPINLHCNLIAKYNLRILADLIQARSSYRAQGEFNIVAAEMRSALIEMWPWAEVFLRPKDQIAAEALSDVRTKIESLRGLIPRADLHDLNIKLAKVSDLILGSK